MGAKYGAYLNVSGLPLEVWDFLAAAYKVVWELVGLDKQLTSIRTAQKERKEIKTFMCCK